MKPKKLKLLFSHNKKASGSKTGVRKWVLYNSDLRSNLIWKINKIFSVKASVVTYEHKRIRKKKLFVQANSKVTLHIWSWASVMFGQSTPLYFKPFLGDGHLTFDGGMGYFRKKMQTDFEGGRSCKEIPGEEISCTETKKYLSWCIMLEKKFVHHYMSRKKFYR